MATGTIDRTDTAAGAGREVPLWLARTGLGTRAVLYELVAYLVLEVAMGRHHGAADGPGALALVGRQLGGAVALVVLGAGFAAYALWRAWEAVTANSWGARAIQAGKALAYVALVAVAGRLAATPAPGGRAGGRGGAGGGQEVDATAAVFRLPLGRVLVFAIAVAIAGAGIANLVRVHRHGYQRPEPDGAPPAAKGAVGTVGVVGLVARAIAFGIVAVLVAAAAVTHDPRQAGGLDTGLRRLAGEPYGPAVLVVLAFGFAAYGLFCAAQAVWDPNPEAS